MKKQPIDINAPNSLLLGVWYQDGLCAIKCSTRAEDGSVTPNVYRNHDPNAWACLYETINACLPLRMRNIIVITNSAKMNAYFTYPIKLPVLAVDQVNILCSTPKPWEAHKTTSITHNATRGYIRNDRVSTTTVSGKKTSVYAAETVTEADPYLWGFARLLMRFSRWRMVHSESIPGTQAYWQECKDRPPLYGDPFE